MKFLLKFKMKSLVKIFGRIIEKYADYPASARSLRWYVVAVTLMMLMTWNDVVSGALRNVNLIIEPPAVRRGQHATLRCSYDLEGAPLYSAKFYRGQLEFYRYTPGESPSTKVFPFPGIYVDISMSNASQVLLRNVGFGLSGNFSCEVTADAPLFSTATAFSTLQVVELPEKRPLLFAEHNRYMPGDILRANCSTPPSRPRAELKFTINNMMINAGETQFIRTVDNLIASRISLKLQLQSIHFTGPGVAMSNIQGGNGGGIGSGSASGQLTNGVGGAGSLILRCTAQIDDLYQEYKELELGTPQRDPVPARVTLSSGSSMKSFFSSYFSSAATSITKTTTTMTLFNLNSLIITSALTSLLLTGNIRYLLTLVHESIVVMAARIQQMRSKAGNNRNNIINNNNNENNSQSLNQSRISRKGLCKAMAHNSKSNHNNNNNENNNRITNLNALQWHSFAPSER